MIYKFHAGPNGSVWTHRAGSDSCKEMIVVAHENSDCNPIAEAAIRLIEAEGDHQEEGYAYVQLKELVMRRKGIISEPKTGMYIPPEVAERQLEAYTKASPIDDDSSKEKQKNCHNDSLPLDAFSIE